MKLKMTAITIFLAANTIACHNSNNENTDESEISSREMKKTPLAISGTWRWVLFQGVNTEKTYLQWKLKKEEAPKLLIGINSEGIGAITSDKSCTPQDPNFPQNGIPEVELSTPAVRVAAIAHMIGNIGGLFNTFCNSKDPGQDTKVVIKAPQLWGNRTEFDDTFGTANPSGQFSGKAAADAECHKMRGWRFVSIDNNVACIGYLDRTATRLGMLVNSTSNYVVQRLEFTK